MLVSGNPFSAVTSANRADGEREVDPKHENKQKVQTRALGSRVIDATINMDYVLQIASDSRRSQGVQSWKVMFNAVSK